MKKFFAFFVSVVVIFLDQLTKHWAMTHVMPYEPVPCLPMLNWTLAFNSGSAFNFLSHAGDWHTWFFLGFSGLMSIVIMVWIIRLSTQAKLELFALSLILGGALGNLIDRIRLGYVVDFIDVFYKNHHWPSFNIADSAICMGGVLLLIDLLMSQRARSSE
jgi:signal peptidase II